MKTIDITAAIKKKQLEIRKLRRIRAPLQELVSDAKRAAGGQPTTMSNVQWSKARVALVEKLFDLGVLQSHYNDWQGNSLQAGVQAPSVWDQVEIT